MLNINQPVRVGKKRWRIESFDLLGMVNLICDDTKARRTVHGDSIEPLVKVGDIVNHAGAKRKVLLVGYNKKRERSYCGLEGLVSVVAIDDIVGLK